MVSNKPTVITIGTLGVGKSTLLIRLVSSEAFKAARTVKRVTTDFNLHEADLFEQIDCSGLEDPEDPSTLADWMAKL